MHGYSYDEASWGRDWFFWGVGGRVQTYKSSIPKYIANIQAPMNINLKTIPVHLLMFNLEVEMAAEPIIERWMLNITSSFQLNKKPQKHILIL